MDTPTSERRIIRELYAKHGRIVTDEVGDHYRAINKALWVHLDKGEITREQLYVRRFENLIQRYPLDVPAEEAASWFLARLAEAYDPQPGAAHLLCRLRQAGVHVFTATNGIGRVMEGRLRHAGLLQWIDACFAADELHAMKPSSAYFDAIFHASGEKDLHRTLMVGDNPVTDVNGAVDYGMAGALFGLRWKEPSRALYAAPDMAHLEAWIFEEENAECRMG